MNKKRTGEHSGILQGVNSLIDEQLGLIFPSEFWKIGTTTPHYEKQGACNLFEDFPEGEQLIGLATAILGRVAANYYRSGVKGAGNSKENWRCKPNPDIEERNPSIEKILEKQIERIFHGAWVNQVPVASGLTGPTANRKNAIDLAWQPEGDDASAVLVELKWED